ncbi:MAG: alpha/beta hydrolase-fold protein [Bacteroidota bacterium]
MKRLPIIIVLLLLFTPSIILAQTGRVFDNLLVTSKILKSERKYSVYLPPDYETSQRSYPVLYLLHGSGGDQGNWIDYGDVQTIADNAINSSKATPMIIVMPDATTGRSGYFNNIKGDWNYEDFFFQELIPHIEKKYRVKAQKRSRAISGLSMGGGGTFMYALHRPEMFSAAYPISASVGALTFEAAKARFTRDNVNLPDSALQIYYSKHNAISLINDMPEAQKKAVKWFIDCGDDDGLDEGNFLAHMAMRKKEIPHEFRIFNGGHNWTYWRTALPNVLEFVSQSFRAS